MHAIATLGRATAAFMTWMMTSAARRSRRRRFSRTLSD
jgi:hypothetical protein